MTEALDTPERSPRMRRSGGRAAQIAARAAPKTGADRPIRAGLEGGQYRPLKEADVLRIHAAALDALEALEIGAPVQLRGRWQRISICQQGRTFGVAEVLEEP